jgi:hypothetical protein
VQVKVNAPTINLAGTKKRVAAVEAAVAAQALKITKNKARVVDLKAKVAKIKSSVKGVKALLTAAIGGEDKKVADALKIFANAAKKLHDVSR